VYALRISIGAVRFFTTPVEIQINSDGITNVLARDKILDSPSSPLIGVEDSGGGGGGGLNGLIVKSGLIVKPALSPAPVASAVGVVSGYNGSQIFNTTLATIDPNEPIHCGASGGSSYWLTYEPPANGTLTLDTIGSAYDTVIEAYTFNGTITGYQDLIPIDCDTGSVANQNPARIQFATVKSRQYLVVVEGVNGARGVAQLNYSVNTNIPPVPPSLRTQPTTISVEQNAPVSIAADLIGTPPLKYVWKKNGTNLAGATTSGISWGAAHTNDTANYTLIVTNDLGTLNATWPLHVIDPPNCAIVPDTNGFSLSLPTVTGFLYTVQEADEVAGPWRQWPTNFTGNGQPLFLNLSGNGKKFFRFGVQ
jgi:hypothetical protein